MRSPAPAWYREARGERRPDDGEWDRVRRAYSRDCEMDRRARRADEEAEWLAEQQRGRPRRRERKERGRQCERDTRGGMRRRERSVGEKRVRCLDRVKFIPERRWTC